VLSKFWEGVGGKLADRWAAVSTPALVFWLGGLLAYAYSRGGLHGLSTVTDWLNQQTTPAQIAVLLTVLLGVAASGVIVQRLTVPVLRLLEGYWPRWSDPLRRRFTDRARRRAVDSDAAWQRLAPQVLPPATPTAELLSEFVRVDQRRRRRPAKINRILPTRIGNILRAAETWPEDKYGLDAIVVWPRLWLLLPDTTRQELLSARAGLDNAVAATIWGVLFCAFSAWTVLTVPVGLAVALASTTIWVPARAEVFGDLLEAAYDLYRCAVYQQLRWPVPLNPHHEHGYGQLLTTYLWRGSDDADPPFTPPL
jgi:hypothetical protein